jgi:hypothetical protein
VTKTCGPARFPTQYPTKMKVDVVDFLVNPAVLLAKSESISGEAGANEVTIQNPASRTSFLC